MFVPFLAFVVSGLLLSNTVILDTPPRINHEVIDQRAPASSWAFND